MVYGVSQNYGMNNAYQNMGYQQSFMGAQAPADEKKSTSTGVKVAVAAVGTAAVAAGTLYGLVKTGKLTKKMMPSGIKDKIQNFAYSIGKKIDDGIKSLTKKSFMDTVKDVASSVVKKVKGLFGKKDPVDKVRDAVAAGVDTAGKAADAAGSIINSATTTIADAAGKAADAIKG